MELKTLAIVQARLGSTRFPNKVLKRIEGKSVIEILLYRLSLSKKIDKILLATGDDSKNSLLSDTIKNLGYDVFIGSESNVLERFYNAAKLFSPEIIVRITGDCPLIDPQIVDQVIGLYQDSDVDYTSNVEPPTFPDGLDVEVFSFDALEKSFNLATSKYDYEHVTTFMRGSNQFKRENFASEHDYSNERWTIDEPEDLIVVRNIIEHFSPNLDFHWKEIINIKSSHSHYFSENQDINRNEGSKLGTGQKLYKRAKKIIPGGTMLLSKRPEMYLPENWPSYFSHAKGCKVWDLDGNELIDMSIMGIGTNTLGYGHSEVDDSVREIINKGNMSTLNCPEEVYLAERLIEIHPWSDMVRFARTGGEANSIAIRIARAACGKDNVAICGYHGWHDWYLSTNISNETGLDNHLLPGLKPNGVPNSLKGTVFPFKYNDFEELVKIIDKNEIGIIKMEVSRSTSPEKKFLEAVRKLANNLNIILIFDECTSGFRETFGGIHKKYDVYPDMMMLGKTLGNGYAITAVLGKENIMSAAQDTFISSTFWTERIGPTAALKTLEIMEREQSWDKITETGKSISKRWIAIAEKHDIPIQINGLPALTNFIIESENWLHYKTFISQEMLKKGFLAGNSVYVCTEHSEDIIDKYFEEIDKIFSTIADCENGLNIEELLQGPVCQQGFGRLN